MRAFLFLALGLLAAPIAKAQGRSDTITPEDIEKAGLAGSAYDLVRTLKPRWLTKTEPAKEFKPGGMLAPTGPHVYLDDRSKFGPTSQPGIVVKLRK